MNLIEMLMGAGQENPDVNFQPSTGVAEQAGLVEALTGAPQAGGVTQPASATGLPPRSPVDNSMLGPLMLLNLAAQVSQRRQYGQSRTNQILEGISNTANYGMATKYQNEKRAQDERKLQLEEAVTSKNIAVADQQMQQRAELHPIAVEAARSGLSKSQAEAKIKEKELATFDELRKAELDWRAAQTDELKARASDEVRSAKIRLQELRVAREQLDLAYKQGMLGLGEQRLALQREQMGGMKVIKGENGNPNQYTWIKDGTNYMARDGISEEEAFRQAKRDVKAREDAGMKFNTEQRNAAIAERAREYTTQKIFKVVYDDSGMPRMEEVKGTTVPGKAPTAPTSPTAGRDTREILPPSDPEYVKIMKQLQAKPEDGVRGSNGRVYTLAPDKKSILVIPDPEKPAASGPGYVSSTKSFSDDEFNSMLADAKAGGTTGKEWLKKNAAELTLGQRKQAIGYY